MERRLDQRRQLELKLDEDLTIDEGRHFQVSDAAASPCLDAARLLLAQGKWAEGFAEFECRAFVSSSDRPRWNGARLPAARLVVLAEDEECDTLAFARFLPELATRVLSLTLAVPAAQAERLKLFAGAFGNVPLVDTAGLPLHDLILPLASAPMALGLSPDEVPPPRPAAWQRRNGPTIGVALAPSRWGRVAETIPRRCVGPFPTADWWRSTRLLPRCSEARRWTPIHSRLPGLSLSSLQMVPQLTPPASPARRSGCCSTTSLTGCGVVRGCSVAGIRPRASFAPTGRTGRV